jgi:hypothetical protein
VSPFDFKTWLEHHQADLDRTFRKLHEEGAGPPDFFEWVAVQHEIEMLRATVQPC